MKQLEKFVAELQKERLSTGSMEHGYTIPPRPPFVDYIELDIAHVDHGVLLTKALDGLPRAPFSSKPIESSSIPESIANHSYAPGPSTFIVHTGYDETFDFSVLNALKSPWIPIPDSDDVIDVRGLTSNSPESRHEGDEEEFGAAKSKGARRGLQTLMISGMVNQVLVIGPSEHVFATPTPANANVDLETLIETTINTATSPILPRKISWLEGVESLHLNYCHNLYFHLRGPVWKGSVAGQLEKLSEEEPMVFHRLKEVTIIENNACHMFMNLMKYSLPNVRRGKNREEDTGKVIYPSTTTPPEDKLTCQPIPKTINQPTRCLEVVRIQNTSEDHFSYEYYFIDFLAKLQMVETMKHLELHIIHTLDVTTDDIDYRSDASSLYLDSDSDSLDFDSDSIQPNSLSPKATADGNSDNNDNGNNNSNSKNTLSNDEIDTGINDDIKDDNKEDGSKDTTIRGKYNSKISALLANYALPKCLPVSIENLRIRGPPAMSAQLPIWIACAQDPTWLPNLKSITLRFDTGIYEGEDQWAREWDRAVEGVAQGEREVEDEEGIDGANTQSDWAPGHPKNEERETFLEVLKRERPRVKIVEGWFRIKS